MSLAVLLGFTCLVAFVYFVYFYEQINDDDDESTSPKETENKHMQKYFFMFYYCTQYCNSVRMTCSIKRLLILSYLK